MSKQKIESIYFLRTMAMLMVVLVHVTGTYMSTLSTGSPSYQAYHFVNWSIRIEAGIFIMIAALVFFYKYKHVKMDRSELSRYYKKRALYIVLPYVVWALFYEGYAIWNGFRSFDMTGIVFRVLQGESYYQFHFIFQIVQLYLIFPVCLYFVQRITWTRKYIWLIGLLIEALYHLASNKYTFIPTQLFFGSLGTYFLGAWIGLHYATLRNKVYNKSNITLTLLTVIFGFSFLFTSYYIYTYDVHILTRGQYLIVHMLYLITGSYLFFRISEILAMKIPAVIPYIKHIAIYSFGFYLVHPFVLKEVAQFVPTPSNAWFHMGILLRYTSTVLLCYGLIWGLHKFFPRPGLLFGKLPNKS